MSNDERKRLRAIVDKLSLARTANDDTPCQMKRCKDCGERKPSQDFAIGKIGGIHGYCPPCMAKRYTAMTERRKQRRAAVKLLPKVKKPHATHPNSLAALARNREAQIPETVQDYVQHASPYWPNVELMEIAISQARPEMRPEIKRRLVAMAAAA